MQTSKARNGSSEIPQRTSPVTPRSARVTKASAHESDSSTAKSTPTKTPTHRSPKVTERRSPRSPVTRSPVTEKKRLSRVSELESQLTKLQEDLKKSKDQLGASESWKRRAQQEAEGAKKQLSSMSEKLEESQRQLMEFSAAEEARLQELRKISQDRDRAWQSELDATQKQQSVDSAALNTAMNEIHRLKQQLEMAIKSESAQLNRSEITNSELQMFKKSMCETFSIIEDLKSQIRNSENAEAEAQAVVDETQQQSEIAKATVETLRVQGLRLMESISSKTAELEESRARVSSLEETVKKLQRNQHTADLEGFPDELPEKIRRAVLESEVEQLRSALEATEIKYREEQIQSTLQIRSAYELADRVKTDFVMREDEIELVLKNANSELAELKTRLIDKEIKLQSISEMNEKLSADLAEEEVNQMESEAEAKLMKLIVDTEELNAKLKCKETELQSLSKENELLKAEVGKRETESRKSYEAAITEVEFARAAEQDALMRLGCVTEEADKSSRRAARVAEQLEAAQTVNAEMEAELRRLRVQSDQWRKAAEAAAAVLTPGSNGRFAERSISETEYQSVAGKLMSSPFSDDFDDESPKKKNGNVMRRFSGLWKKTPK